MEIKYAEAFFLTDSLNELNIVSDDKEIEQYNLYWTYDLNPLTSNKTYLLTSNQKNMTFEFKFDKNRRNYFILEFKNSKPILFGHRILPIEGMYNFRDIGGYLTESGKRIKWGAAYRSDHLFNLKDSGLEYAKSLGIQTVIDYRSLKEAEESPNRNIDSRICTYTFDPNGSIAILAGNLQQSEVMKKEDSIIEAAREAVKVNPDAGCLEMINQQLKFVQSPESKKAFKGALQLLAVSANSPSLQHCRGGKDRTGFALMLLEGILGVDDETLVYDYMLTRRARAEKNKRYYNRFLEISKDEKVANYLYSLYDTKNEFIEASIEEIKLNYGSISNYAIESLEINKDEIQQLLKIFLED